MVEEKKQTAAEKRLSVSEVRRTIAASLGTAFGFVIGLLWNQVVTGGLNVIKVNPTLTDATPLKWAYFVVAAVVLTIVMVILIIIISRWGSK